MTVFQPQVEAAAEIRSSALDPGMTAAVSPAETTDIDIDRLTALADVMLPAAHGMPSVSDVKAVESYLAKVLSWRDDLRQPLVRAVDALDPNSFTVNRLVALHADDENAYVALTTVVAACYYLSPVVRELIGYPGQVAKTYDPYAFTEWVAEGLLEPVVERGSIWREAPE